MKTNFFSPGVLASNGSKSGTKSVFAGALLAATALLFACSTDATTELMRQILRGTDREILKNAIKGK